MSLLQVAAQNRLACIAQLYDQWHGYYMTLINDENGARVLGRKLSRQEAIDYRGDVEIVWGGSFTWAVQ